MAGAESAVGSFRPDEPGSCCSSPRRPAQDAVGVRPPRASPGFHGSAARARRCRWVADSGRGGTNTAPVVHADTARAPVVSLVDEQHVPRHVHPSQTHLGLWCRVCSRDAGPDRRSGWQEGRPDQWAGTGGVNGRDPRLLNFRSGRGLATTTSRPPFGVFTAPSVCSSTSRRFAGTRRSTAAPTLRGLYERARL